jgi:tetratricopeptide (TPR) repeat protein
VAAASSGAGASWSLAGLLVATFLVYLPSLANQLTNWDDDRYLLNNPLVSQLSPGSLAHIFAPTTVVFGNYHPLTLLACALEWRFAGADPTAYHLASLLLHLVSTVLVFRIALELSPGSARGALVTAALFALHPMHVESVAWIAEQKDVLYGAFFLGALLLYLRHAAAGRARHLAGALLLFVLSLLAKGQAVVLPVAMLLADAYQRRPLTRRSLLEKAPFFLLALAFGVLAVLAQKADGNLNKPGLAPWQSPFFACWGLVLYLARFVVPAPLSAFHPYPLGPNGTLPPWVLAGPLVLLALAILFFRARAAQRDLFFGVLFFALTIAPVLQLLPINAAFVAERYTYIPYLGLCWVVGQAWARAAVHGGRVRGRVLRVAVVAAIACFALVSGLRARVWRDSIALWSDVLAKYPDCTLALSNRSLARLGRGESDLAVQDCERLVALSPRSVPALIQYAGALQASGREPEAVAALDRGVALDSTDARLFVNRGVVQARMGRVEAALRDFTRALALDPADRGGRLGRGQLYLQRLGRYDLAAGDFAAAAEREPNDATAGCYFGLALYRAGRYAEALRQLDHAVATWPRLANAYGFRAQVRAALGDTAGARGDLATAEALSVAGD